jgi:hypothetical protein
MLKVQKEVTTQVYKLQEGNKAIHFESVYDLATYLKYHDVGVLGYVEKFDLYATTFVEEPNDIS